MLYLYQLVHHIRCVCVCVWGWVGACVWLHVLSVQDDNMNMEEERQVEGMRIVSSFTWSLSLMMSCDVITLEQGYNIYHQLNLYVLQVRNLCSCVKVAEDFVSPEVSSTNDLVMLLQIYMTCKTYTASMCLNFWPWFLFSFHYLACVWVFKVNGRISTALWQTCEPRRQATGIMCVCICWMLLSNQIFEFE